MFLQQLFEAIDKRHAAFCFGRMNPPTLGHKQLADTVAKAAAGGDYFIFTSQTQDSKKNPLDYATKVKFLQALMPEHASHIIYNPSLKTIIQVAQWLYAKGYRSVTFVAGSDRLDNFQELLNKYNGAESPNGFYQFDSINFASSGDRDPDGDGLAGISATAAREAAKADNLEAFSQATGAGKLAPQLFQAVRKGMLLEYLVKEELAPGEGVRKIIQGYSVVFSKEAVEIYKGHKLLLRRVGDYSNPTGTQLGSINRAIELLMTKEQQGYIPNAEQISKRYELEQQVKALDQQMLPLERQQNSERSDLHNKISAMNPGNRMWDDEQSRAWDEGWYKIYKKPEYVELVKQKSALTKQITALKKSPDWIKVNECSGYIPKNKREAKDPRWSNALTVDVHPDTPTKNLKAFKLA